MKILDEYVIILNILLFLLLLYNFLQKCKIIEGHAPTSSEINNTENAKATNKKGDVVIQQVVDKEKEAGDSDINAKSNIDETDWEKHNKNAEEMDEELAALNE